MQKPSLPEEILESLPVEVRGHIAYLEVQLKFLEGKIAELEARLNQNSQNSSKPPSSDPPATPPRATSAKSGKKRGGQPGHSRHLRKLVPLEEVTEVKEWWPRECGNPKCRQPLRPRDQQGQPLRQQISEIRLSPLIITEHQYQACECRYCGKVTRAVRPPTVPTGMFGLQLVATVATLHGRYRLTEREVQQVVSGLWGLELSLGSVAQMCQQTSEALAKPYQAILEQIASRSHLNVDETGWKLGKAKQWLWVAVSQGATVFHLDGRRDRAAFRKLVKESYGGVITSDRLKATTIWQQVCISGVGRI